MGVKILSLFDGMACGMIAMQLAGVEVESYDAYEIDKYAIKTAQHNFPMIIEHGDVFDADFTQYEGVDFLVGGSPCTYWSIAQTKNRETVASGMGWELFSQYVRALHEAKPKYFIYENNKSMSKQIRASIDEAFGFEAVLINSALVSAQNRQRLYWVGKRNADGTYSRVNVEQPADRGILLKDVLDNAVYAKSLTDKEMDYMMRDHQERRWNFCNRPGEKDKSECITANIHKGVPYNVVAEPINVTADSKSQTIKAQHANSSLVNLCCYTSTYGATGVAEPINVTEDGKAQCLRATCYKDGIRNIIANEVDKKTGVAEPINDICQVGAMPRPDGEVSTSAGFRIYSTEAKGRYLCANGGGAGAKTGLYAVPYDCDVVITENSIRCQRRDQKHSTVQGSHVNFTDGKTQTLSPSHIPNVIEPKSCGDLYAIPTMPVKEATAKGYTEIECGDCVDLSMPNSKTRRGRSMADKANCMQTSNDFYQYVGYAIEFDDDGRPIKAINADGKEITIYEVRDGKITIKGKQYPIKLKDGYYIIRKLTVSECKRLQTVPEWYEFPVSNSQAYKMLGNGWTCEVIAHLIRSCMAEQWGGIDG